MLRSCALALSLLLACGGLWACGRKSAPSLPEGEQLRTEGEGFKSPISVYSPYEEELKQIEETGADVDVGPEEGGVLAGEPEVVVPPPDETGKDLGVGELAPPSGTTGAGKRPGRLEDLRRGVEEVLRGDDESSEAVSPPADSGGHPPSPGSPLEGGF